MKSLCVLILMLTTSINLYGQELLGEFANEYASLEFKSDSSIEFNLPMIANWNSEQKIVKHGAGKWFLNEDFLIIQIQPIQGRFLLVDFESTKPFIKLKTDDNQPLLSALGEFYYNSDSLIGRIPAENGLIPFDSLEADSVHLFSDIFYYPVDLKIEKNHGYEVTLQSCEGFLVSNGILIYRIHKSTPEKLILKPVFESSSDNLPNLKKLRFYSFLVNKKMELERVKINP